MPWSLSDVEVARPHNLVEGSSTVAVVSLDYGLDRAYFEEMVAAPQRRDQILVGRCEGPVPDSLVPLARQLDFTLVPYCAEKADRSLIGVQDVDEAVSEVVTAIGGNPSAATVLGSLLRWTGQLQIPDALDVESLAYSTLLGGEEFRAWLRGRSSSPGRVPESRSESSGEEEQAEVLLDRDGARLRIDLNNPRRHNAYSAGMRDALVRALQMVDLDPSIEEVLLAGRGRSFCAGGDLTEFGTTPDPLTAHFIRTRSGAALRLARVASRVTAHLHGACAGAGIELPAYASWVVADAETQMWLPELAMGLIPGAGGTVSIPRRIGRWRAAYLGFTGHHLSASRALDWGLVDEVI